MKYDYGAALPISCGELVGLAEVLKVDHDE